MLIPISEITVDSSLQPRNGLNKDKLTEYSKLLLDSSEFDPVDLFYDGSNYWLADGFHRIEVYKKAGKTHIPATVREGTRRNAIIFGIERNTKHGLGLSLKERKNAARRLLLDSEWSQWSNNKIGRICGIDHKTVQKLKIEVIVQCRKDENLTNFANLDSSNKNPELLQSVSWENPKMQNFTNTSDDQVSLRKVFRGGHEYTIETAKIGRNSSQKGIYGSTDQTVDITSTTQTVYDFLPPASDNSLNDFKILLASYGLPLFSDDKIELSLKLFWAGPTFALPLILDQMVACPLFAQHVYSQALKLSAKINGTA